MTAFLGSDGTEKEVSALCWQSLARCSCLHQTDACFKVVCHMLELKLTLSSLSGTESVSACFPTGNVVCVSHAM